jgi:hypothetical protein
MALTSMVKPVSLRDVIFANSPMPTCAALQNQYSRRNGELQLKALIASAKTPADHEAIAAYYHAKAQHFWAKYRREEAAFTEYYRNPLGYPSKYPTVGDTDRSLASHYEMRAQRATALEQMQENLAHKGK